MNPNTADKKVQVIECLVSVDNSSQCHLLDSRHDLPKIMPVLMLSPTNIDYKAHLMTDFKAQNVFRGSFPRGFSRHFCLYIYRDTNLALLAAFQ